jgi:WD40 repeat protein
MSLMRRLLILLTIVQLIPISARGADTVAAGPAMRILKENCVSCHNSDKKKGKLILTSREGALAGGESGPALVVGKAAQSRMIEALSSAADPHMPPKEQLSDAEIALLTTWIDSGAPWDAHSLATTRPAANSPIVLRRLPASYQPVLCMSLSPDQKQLAIGRGDHIRLFDLTNPARPMVQELATPNDPVTSLAWSGDGRWLASGGYRQVRLWDPRSFTQESAIVGLSGRVTAVAFVPNQPILIAADGEVGSAGTLRLWHIPDGAPLGDWTAHDDSIFSMKVSSDGKWLATAGADKLAKVWDLSTHREVAKLEGHAGPVMAVALSKDGTSLAPAGSDKEIKIWKVSTKEQTASLMTSPTAVTDLAWANEKTLVSTSEDGIARFSSEANKERAERAFNGAPDVLHCVAITTDGKTIFGGCHDGNVYVWTAATGKLEGSLPLATRPVAASQPSIAAMTPPVPPISFPNDIMPLITRAGCNAGACHAKPAGQAGFKLSVFGYDPKSDYRAILKSARGRRIFPAAPEESLLLKKPTMTVEHGGGLRLKKDTQTYRTLLAWLEQGAPYGRENDPILAKVEVSPKEGRYHRQAVQPLRVVATYSDGSQREVTNLAEFASNEKELARVDEQGVVHVGDMAGEAVIVTRYMGRVDISRITVPADKALPESLYTALPVNNFIDKLVYDRLRNLAIAPSDGCTDAEFLRRASLDAAGALPTPEQARAFLDDPDPDKRNKLIDRLLASPTYADHWANKWGDLLRPNPFRAGVKSVFTLDQWLRDSFRQNKPFDQFVREILVAQGSTHKYGPTVVFRDRREPADIAPFISQVFLGLRLECAKCHHHPNEKWAQEDFYQLAAFFGQIRRKGQGISAPISGEAEYIWFAPGGKGDVRHPLTGEVMSPKAPDAPAQTIAADRDPREALADWVSRPDNPFFARAIVNRVWGDFMGRGIVHPVDDFRASNPPSNQPLLDALAQDFVEHHYDLKHLIRTIMRSHVYQLSSLPNEYNVRDTRNYSRFYRRRPAAEVALDAVSDVTGTSEPLQGLAPGSRAVQVWNNRLESDFLDAFGRPNASADPPCERERESSVVQALHLMNSTRLMAKIASPTGRAAKLAQSDQTPEQIVTELYLAALSRPPTDEELEIATPAFTAEGATRKSATEDILWALMNSAEFVFNH